MSDLQFNLQLVEEITGPSKLAQDALKKLQAQATAAGESLDFSKQAKASINALASLKLDPKGFLAAHEATKKLADEQRKLIRSHEGFFGGLKSAVTSPFANTTSAVALGELAGEGIIKAGEFLVESAIKVAEIIKEGITLAFESGGKQERLQTSFKYLFAGAEGAKEALEQAERLSAKLPFGGLRTAGYIGDLGRAGIKGQSASNSLALAADAGALSPSGQGADEALAALERLKRHGEFSPRLAEGLNVNLTDFYAALGKKLNVSAAAAQKKLSTPGAVGFNTIQNTLLDVHQKAIGGAATGTVAIEQSKELLARWEKIKELPEEYLRSVANSSGWHRLSETLGRVLEQLDPTKHPEIVNSLLGAFNQLADQAQKMLTPENIDRFAKAVADLPASIMKVADALNTALKVAEATATIIAGIKLVNLASGGGAAAAGAAGNTAAGVAGGGLAGLGTNLGRGVALGKNLLARTPEIALAALPFAANFNNPHEQAQQDAIKAKGDEDIAAGRTVEHKHWWGSTFDYNQKPGEQAGVSQQQRGTITLAPVIHVTVQAAPGDTAEDHGRAVAEAAGKHLSNELERAAQQSGAM